MPDLAKCSKVKNDNVWRSSPVRSSGASLARTWSGDTSPDAMNPLASARAICPAPMNPRRCFSFPLGTGVGAAAGVGVGVGGGGIEEEHVDVTIAAAGGGGAGVEAGVGACVDVVTVAGAPDAAAEGGAGVWVAAGSILLLSQNIWCDDLSLSLLF